MQTRPLQPTSWLAERLGLSISTMERLRAQAPADLPPHVTIGGSIRYDEATVEAWLQSKMRQQTSSPAMRRPNGAAILRSGADEPTKTSNVLANIESR